MIAWIGLALAALGLLGAVNAWFGTRAGDGEYVLYTLMIVGGIVLFVVLS